ncbi:amidohydrolase family protein [Achromobacter aloeverae]|uniref:Amidohydrolase n=1 Tax=Achromobacter aloeverae TaxID=1750518 RepID=A0A4Q1HLA4_9BURK|nr:amidohydrolase family protein [Achromobacter aloeverae]RXN91026.1 amidohydrolase [Achromobacter aloeverae]
MPDCLPPLDAPSRPHHALPPLTCDSHCHIFGPADVFPYAAQRSYTPPDAPYEKLAALHRHLGVERAVIVQAACHGDDHSALLDAVARSEGRYRGVGLLGAETTDAKIEALHAGGIRAARFNFVAHLGKPPAPDVFDRIARQVAAFGWHLCLHVDGPALTALLPTLRQLPLPFVVDHMGRVRAGDGLDQPAFQGLLQLADVAQAWVKVSGVDRISLGKRPYPEGLPFVSALARAMPDRVLWGTDWPHPNVAGDMPDDGELVDLFFQAVPDAQARQRILVDNPARLYGF